MLDRADANLPAQLSRISVQQRSQNVAEDPIALGSIVRNPGPHRRERIRKAVRVPAPPLELARQLSASGREQLRRRVVGGTEPAVSQPRHPSQPRLRTPASDPQRNPTPGAEPAPAANPQARGNSLHPPTTALQQEGHATPLAPRRTASTVPRKARRRRRNHAWMTQALGLRRAGPRKVRRWPRAPSPAQRDLAEREATPSWPG